MTKNSVLQEIQISPGVMPSTDATPSDIPCWASAYGVRFDPTTGRLRKLGGWQSSIFDFSLRVMGYMRSIYSATINQKVYTVLGTNSFLYSLIGSRLDNISPLLTTTVAAPNSLSTSYASLGSNPITTTNGSNLIVVADGGSNIFFVGDGYKLSGSSSVNGVPNTDINGVHSIIAISPGLITIRVPTAATSSGTGGGGAVVRSCGAIILTKVGTTVKTGQRIKIAGAANTGGILAAEINQQFSVRVVAGNDIYVFTNGYATSSVSAAGGAGTEYYQQIDDGNINQGVNQGYGAGYYGAGLYGTALVSISGEYFPRIWFIDRYGDNIIMTPGNSGSVYTWDGNTEFSVDLVANAPTDVNYAFISDNILVTFGHDAENKIFASDQGDITQWTASSTNQVFEDYVEGSGKLISHVPVDGYNLIFTEQRTYTFKYIGGSLVWQINLLDSAIGLIAPMARVSVNGYAYWMGWQNFYMFRGGKIEVIPSNIGLQSSILRYVFDDINYSQRFKVFAWYNEKFDEIWWHYPSSQSNECDKVARFSRKLNCWVPDNMPRTAAEYPEQNLTNPRTGNVDTLYIQESGNDADGIPLVWGATTKKYITGKDTNVQTQIVPDSIMTGSFTFNARMYNYPQSTVAMASNNYTITQSTEKVPVQMNGRSYDFTFAGDELGQSFLMGQWYEMPQKGATAP